MGAFGNDHPQGVGYAQPFMDRLWESLRNNWRLDPDIAFLNHGSFGACPVPVLEYQRALREEMERNPVQFMARKLPERLAQVREEVAKFVHAEERDIAFTANATSGVNAVLRSLAFHPGDEILTTDHLYAACRNALDYVCARTGARVVVATVPFPVSGPQQVVHRVMERVTERTRLAVLDHVTSITGLVFPISELVAHLRLRGVETLVDGAHALGMVDVNLQILGAGYYAGNFHKWVCAPKGSGMLWVRRDLQSAIVPGCVSHGWTRDPAQRFQSLFDWQGTTDPTAWLSVGEALRFMGSLFVGGFRTVQSRNRRLALLAREALCEAVEMTPPCPESMIGSLVSVPVRARSLSGADITRLRSLPTAEQLYERLVKEGFETLVMPFPAPPQRVLRVSAQVYNSPQDYERLAAVLPRLLD